MNTIHIREVIGLTQVDLSEKFAIPIETLVDWDTNDSMPEYVYRLMSEYYLLSEHFETALAILTLHYNNPEILKKKAKGEYIRKELVTWKGFC